MFQGFSKAILGLEIGVKHRFFERIFLCQNRLGFSGFTYLWVNFWGSLDIAWMLCCIIAIFNCSFNGFCFEIWVYFEGFKKCRVLGLIVGNLWDEMSLSYSWSKINLWRGSLGFFDVMIIFVTLFFYLVH